MPEDTLNKPSDYTSWNAPELQDGQLVQVERLKNRGPRGELIDVNKNEVIYNSLTAAQLEDIANQAYEDVKENAHKEGFKQGHEEGYAAGLEAGKDAVSAQANGLKAAIDNVFHYLAGQDDEVEQALVNVATCIASSVLRRELTIEPSSIAAVVREAVAELPMNAGNITVYLSEQDHQLLSDASEIPEQWQLQIDRTLSAGGCRVRTEHSVVDYTLEDQFQQSVNHMVEQRFAQLAENYRQRHDTTNSRENTDTDS